MSMVENSPDMFAVMNSPVSGGASKSPLRVIRALG